MFGVFDLPWWGYISVVLVLTQITVISVTLYLHRCQAHRSLNLHPIVSHFFRFWLWLTTGMETKTWTAIHRKHHAKVETEDDPHSPQTRGIKKVFFEGAELYRAEAKNSETLEKYGEGTPDDWIERNLYVRFSSLGIALMLVIDFVLFGFLGISMWAVQMMWIPFFAAGVINGIGHYWGYRNFECKDASRNVIPIAIFLGGEELHNNHHGFGTSAKFSAKWWEVDLGWGIIRFLSWFGLAKPRRVIPKLAMLPAKNAIDVETLRAVISNRFQIMASYARTVILPMLSQEKQRASNASRALLRRTRGLLIRDAHVLKKQHQLRLSRVLDNFQSLRVVYQFRLKLQDIWSRSTASQKELLDALQEWCRQAEATGIDALVRFTQQLKMLTCSDNVTT